MVVYTLTVCTSMRSTRAEIFARFLCHLHDASLYSDGDTFLPHVEMTAAALTGSCGRWDLWTSIVQMSIYVRVRGSCPVDTDSNRCAFPTYLITSFNIRSIMRCPRVLCECSRKAVTRNQAMRCKLPRCVSNSVFSCTKQMCICARVCRLEWVYGSDHQRN